MENAAGCALHSEGTVRSRKWDGTSEGPCGSPDALSLLAGATGAPRCPCDIAGRAKLWRICAED